MKRVLNFTGIAGIFIGLVAMTLTLFKGNVSEIAFWHYNVSGILLGIYLISLAPGFFRLLKSRQARTGAMVSLFTLVVIAVVVLINFMGLLTNYQVADLTEKGVYSLSGESKKVLASMEKDLNMYVFFAGGREGLRAVRDIDRLLKTFETSSPKIKIKIIDPEVEVVTAEQFKIYQDGTMVLEYNKKRKKINTITESNVTNSLMQLLDERPKKVCFTTGHGERSIEGEAAYKLDGLGKLKKLIEDKNYTAGTIELATTEQIPAECTVVAITGPVTPISTPELVIVESYLRQGGRVLVAQDAGVASGINNLVKKWGIKYNDNVVLEKVFEGIFSDSGFTRSKMKISANLTITDYGRSNPAVRDLSVKHPVFMTKARSLSKVETRQEIKVSELFKSKKESWGENRVNEALSLGRAVLSPRDGDTPGPLTLGMAATMITQQTGTSLTGYSRQARLVVVGNSMWLQNVLLDESRNFNGELAINIIGWLAGMEEFLAIGAKSASAKSMYLSYRQKKNLFNATMVFLPEFFLFLGLLVWWMRR